MVNEHKEDTGKTERVKPKVDTKRKWPNSKLTDAEIEPRYQEHLIRVRGPAKVGGK